MPTTTVTSKGQVTIPAQVRKKLDLHAGDKVDFRIEPDGTVRLLPLTRKVSEVFGILSRKDREAVTINDMNKGLRAGFKSGKL